MNIKSSYHRIGHVKETTVRIRIDAPHELCVKIHEVISEFLKDDFKER